MRVMGRINGDTYELVQNGVVKQAIPLSQVDDKLRAAIRRNKWETPK
jgi:hypothetical protein